MIGFGVVTAALSLLGLFMMRGGRNPAEKKWFYRAALWTIPFPLIANSFGWIFTEMGRQPWVVFSQMFTRDGVSPAGRAGPRGHVADRAEAAVPGVAIVEVGLLVRYVKAGPPDTRRRPRPRWSRRNATPGASTTG